nr:PREDICTED: proteasome subunit beta type-6-like [Nicotiana tabacum]
MEMDRLLPHSTEATILGATYEGGVVLGANSPTSTGMHVTSRLFNKITELADNVYVCADDAQIVSDYVRHFRIQLGQPTTVRSAANFVSSLSYNNKVTHQTGRIVGGWDKYDGGNIYGIPVGGTVLEPQRFAIEGRESSYLHAFLDRAWREGMNQEEAEKLVVNAVSLAIARHGGASSDGAVLVVTISKDGATSGWYSSIQRRIQDLQPVNSLLEL